jgi:hypothetical protein
MVGTRLPLRRVRGLPAGQPDRTLQCYGWYRNAATRRCVDQASATGSAGASVL